MARVQTKITVDCRRCGTPVECGVEGEAVILHAGAPGSGGLPGAVTVRQRITEALDKGKGRDLDVSEAVIQTALLELAVRGDIPNLSGTQARAAAIGIRSVLSTS